MQNLSGLVRHRFQRANGKFAAKSDRCSTRCFHRTFKSSFLPQRPAISPFGGAGPRASWPGGRCDAIHEKPAQTAGAPPFDRTGECSRALANGPLFAQARLAGLRRFFTEFQSLTNRGKEVVELHFLVDREIPEIVEIPRFVSGWIGESNCFLGSNFVEGVHKNGPIFGNVGELCISAKNGPICERER